jgi:hypothetical protein
MRQARQQASLADAMMGRAEKKRPREKAAAQSHFLWRKRGREGSRPNFVLSTPRALAPDPHLKLKLFTPGRRWASEHFPRGRSLCGAKGGRKRLGKGRGRSAGSSGAGRGWRTLQGRKGIQTICCLFLGGPRSVNGVVWPSGAGPRVGRWRREPAGRETVQSHEPACRFLLASEVGWPSGFVAFAV